MAKQPSAHLNPILGGLLIVALISLLNQRLFAYGLHQFAIWIEAGSTANFYENPWHSVGFYGVIYLIMGFFTPRFLQNAVVIGLMAVAWDIALMAIDLTLNSGWGYIGGAETGRAEAIFYQFHLSVALLAFPAGALIGQKQALK